MRFDKNRIHSADEMRALLKTRIESEENVRAAIIREQGPDFIARRVKSCDEMIATHASQIEMLEKQKAELLAKPTSTRELLQASLATTQELKKQLRQVAIQHKANSLWIKFKKVCKRELNMDVSTVADFREQLEKRHE